MKQIILSNASIAFDLECLHFFFILRDPKNRNNFKMELESDQPSKDKLININRTYIF